MATRHTALLPQGDGLLYLRYTGLFLKIESPNGFSVHRCNYIRHMHPEGRPDSSISQERYMLINKGTSSRSMYYNSRKSRDFDTKIHGHGRRVHTFRYS